MIGKVLLKLTSCNAMTDTIEYKTLGTSYSESLYIRFGNLADDSKTKINSLYFDNTVSSVFVLAVPILAAYFNNHLRGFSQMLMQYEPT